MIGQESLVDNIFE